LFQFYISARQRIDFRFVDIFHDDDVIKRKTKTDLRRKQDPTIQLIHYIISQWTYREIQIARILIELSQSAPILPRLSFSSCRNHDRNQQQLVIILRNNTNNNNQQKSPRRR
jgi:hypothetical protein